MKKIMLLLCTFVSFSQPILLGHDNREEELKQEIKDLDGQIEQNDPSNRYDSKYVGAGTGLLFGAATYLAGMMFAQDPDSQKAFKVSAVLIGLGTGAGAYWYHNSNTMQQEEKCKVLFVKREETKEKLHSYVTIKNSKK